MNLVARQNFGHKANLGFNTEIGGVSGTISTPALLATKLGISVGNISNFTVVGSDVKCRITGNYALTGFFDSNITFFNDADGLCTSIPNGAFYNTPLVNLYMKNCTSIQNNCFDQNVYKFQTLKTLYIPNCTSFGTSAENNNLFRSNISTCKIYAHPSMSTINGGGVEGDLAGMVNSTIIYVTNFTAPNPVTDLSAGTIYNAAVQLNFTAPSSTNAIDYYECYADGVYKNNITASGGFIAGLTPSTSYNNITVIAVDIFYNKSVVSNSLSAITTNNAWDIATNLVSYYKLNNSVVDSFKANNGIATDITYASGIIGDTAVLNGTTSNINFGNLSDFQISNGSLSCWIKTSNAGTSFRSIFIKSNAYSLFLNGNVLITYDWGTATIRSTGLSVNNNAWRHVVLTFQSGVTNGTKIYLDGVLVLTTTITVLNQTSPLTMGINTTVQHFNGSIDEGYIYNAVLTQTQIDLIYNAGNGITL